MPKRLEIILMRVPQRMLTCLQKRGLSKSPPKIIMRIEATAIVSVAASGMGFRTASASPFTGWRAEEGGTLSAERLHGRNRKGVETT